MNLVHYIKQAFQISLLNKKAVRDVAKDKKALIPGLVFFVLGSLVALYVQYANGKAPMPLYLYLPVLVLIVLAMLGLVHGLARLFGSKENIIHFLRPTLISSLFSVLGLVSILPLIGPALAFFVSIWSLVIFFVVIKESYKLSTGRAVGIILLMFLALLIVAMMIGLVVGISMVAQNPSLYLPQ